MINWDNFSNLISIIIAVFALVLAWRKAPGERTATDAQAAKSYAEAAEKSRVAADEAEKRALAWANRAETTAQELSECLTFKDAIMAWAKKLCAQVVLLGGDPVPLVMPDKSGNIHAEGEK
jgi:hypothetical protein